MENKQIYIQTVNGPKLFNDLKGYLSLPYEHISQNLSQFQYDYEDCNKYEK